MFGYAQTTGVPDDVIWSEMYYSDFGKCLVQTVIQHLFFHELTGLLVNHPTLIAITQLYVRPCKKQAIGKQSINTAFAVLALPVTSLWHVTTDLPLHNDRSVIHN